MIDIQNVTKVFGKKVAVKNISLHLKQGEVIGFLGPNGAGKTTTMKMILGLLRPDKGNILLFGKPAGSLEVRKKIGFLPEFAHFYQHLTGKEFLYFIGDLFHLPKDQTEKRVRKLLKLVHLPVESHDRYVGTYSKGMQQRIGMAQALMNDPEVLFLDEPMSGLDPIGRREMKDIILSLKDEGKTIFFNSHILSDAEAICDRVGIIHNGQLLVDSPLHKLVSKTKTLEDVFIETVTGKKTINGIQKQKPDVKRKNAVKKLEKKTSVKSKPLSTKKKGTAKKSPSSQKKGVIKKKSPSRKTSSLKK